MSNLIATNLPAGPKKNPKIRKAQFTLWVHDQNFSNVELVINPDYFPPGTKIGDIVEIYKTGHREKSLFLAVGAVTTIKANLQLSVKDTIASACELNNREEINASVVAKENVTVEFAEVTFKDQFISRSDMWRLKQHLKESCAYVGKPIQYCCMRAQIRELLTSSEQPVHSGYITADTKFVFRSRSAEYIIFFQMSREMWQFAPDGQLYFEKAVNKFLPSLFQKWRLLGANHCLTMILFSRTYYNISDRSYQEESMSQSGPIDELLSENRQKFTPAATVEDDFNQFTPQQQEQLMKDYDGRYFHDFYTVVCVEERTNWERVVLTLKKKFEEYAYLVNWKLPESTSIDPFKYRSTVLGENSTAEHSGFLEAINLGQNMLDARHFADRDLTRTGQSIVVISAGTGVFIVNPFLEQKTKQRMIDKGIGCDLVCVTKPPLHIVPMFIMKLPFGYSSSNSGNTLNNNATPHHSKLNNSSGLPSTSLKSPNTNVSSSSSGVNTGSSISKTTSNPSSAAAPISASTSNSLTNSSFQSQQMLSPSQNQQNQHHRNQHHTLLSSSSVAGSASNVGPNSQTPRSNALHQNSPMNYVDHFSHNQNLSSSSTTNIGNLGSSILGGKGNNINSHKLAHWVYLFFFELHSQHDTASISSFRTFEPTCRLPEPLLESSVSGGVLVPIHKAPPISTLLNNNGVQPKLPTTPRAKQASIHEDGLDLSNMDMEENPPKVGDQNDQALNLDTEEMMDLYDMSVFTSSSNGKSGSVNSHRDSKDSKSDPKSNAQTPSTPTKSGSRTRSRISVMEDKTPISNPKFGSSTSRTKTNIAESPTSSSMMGQGSLGNSSSQIHHSSTTFNSSVPQQLSSSSSNINTSQANRSSNQTHSKDLQNTPHHQQYHPSQLSQQSHSHIPHNQQHHVPQLSLQSTSSIAQHSSNLSLHHHQSSAVNLGQYHNTPSFSTSSSMISSFSVSKSTPILSNALAKASQQSSVFNIVEVNPFELTIKSAPPASNRRRWEHLWARHSIQFDFLDSDPQGPHWKSLSQPALLPLTTAYFPSTKELNERFQNYVQTVFPDDGVYAGGMQVHLAECVSQRLSQGYQLMMVTSSSSTSSGGTTSTSTAGNPSSSDSKTALLSAGHSFHKLTIRGMDIRVDRYLDKTKLEKSNSWPLRNPIPYKYFMWSEHTGRLLTKLAQLHYQSALFYQWDLVDSLLMGHELNFQPTYNFWKINMMLVAQDRTASSQTIASNFSKFKEFLTQRIVKLPDSSFNGMKVTVQISQPSSQQQQTNPSLSSQSSSNNILTNTNQGSFKNSSQSNLLSNLQAQTSSSNLPSSSIDQLIDPHNTHLILSSFIESDLVNESYFKTEKPANEKSMIFIGSKLIDWMIQKVNIHHRQEAIGICNEFLKEGTFKPLSSSQGSGFRDGPHHYLVVTAAAAPSSGDGSLKKIPSDQIITSGISIPDSSGSGKSVSNQKQSTAPMMVAHSLASDSSSYLSSRRNQQHHTGSQGHHHHTIIQTGSNPLDTSPLEFGSSSSQHHSITAIDGNSVSNTNISGSISHANNSLNGHPLPTSLSSMTFDPPPILPDRNVETETMRLQMDPTKTDGYEWANVVYDTIFDPKVAFEIQFQWLSCTGCVLADFIQQCTRKAKSFGFSFIQIPCDHKTSHSFLSPRKGSFRWSELASRHQQAICYVLMNILDFLPRKYHNQFIHRTGVIIIDISDGTFEWSVNWTDCNAYTTANNFELLRRFRDFVAIIESLKNDIANNGSEYSYDEFVSAIFQVISPQAISINVQ